MIRKNLLQLIFSGACLWRWNDKLRPVELSEIEKQAHKMLVACALWHESSRKLTQPQATSLAAQIIEGSLFDYFYRLIITDIKPPVFYKIKENQAHYRKLTAYVIKTLEPILAPTGSFWERCKAWHNREEREDSPARKILNAAHLFASRWEFKLIQPHNPFDEEMDAIDQSFTNSLNEYHDLPGLEQFLNPEHSLAKFANLCGQLRFQIRWTQTPRMPATSVLGHMFVVAVCAYLYSLSITACPQRANNNFFSGLFHDFPEVLTRDIISPVKKSYSGLAQLIKEYEEEELERRVLGPLRNSGMDSFVDRISWYLGLQTGSEFKEAIKKNQKIIALDSMAALDAYNFNEYDPRDGQLLKTCDLLSAFLEAYNSIRNGASSPQLVEGKARLKGELINFAPEPLQIEALLADFD